MTSTTYHLTRSVVTGHRSLVGSFVAWVIAGLDGRIRWSRTAASLARLDEDQLRDIGATAELDRRGHRQPVDARTVARLVMR